MKVCWNVLRWLTGVWQTEIRTTKALDPEPNAVEFQTAIENLNGVNRQH